MAQLFRELFGEQEWRVTLAEQPITAGSTAASGIRGDNPNRKALLPGQLCRLESRALQRAFDQDHCLDQAQLESPSEGEVAIPRLGALGPFRDQKPLGGNVLLQRL